MALTQLELSDYFATISPLARKMVAEAREVIAREGAGWDEMTQEERNQKMDSHFIGGQHAMTNRLGDGNIDNPALDLIFPRLKLHCRQEVVHLKEGDHEEAITYKDEFSGEFNWESRSQQELRLDKLGKPAVFDRTPPPSRHNKAAWKRSHQEKRKKCRSNESTPSVEFSEILANSPASDERHSASPARPISDGLIGVERRSQLSSSSNEIRPRAASQGSGGSDKLMVPSANVRLSGQLIPEVEPRGRLWSEVTSELVAGTTTSKIPTMASSQAVNEHESMKMTVPSLSTHQPKTSNSCQPKRSSTRQPSTSSSYQLKPSDTQQLKAVSKAEETTITSSTDSFKAPDKWENSSSVPESEQQTSTFDFLTDW